MGELKFLLFPFHPRLAARIGQILFPVGILSGSDEVSGEKKEHSLYLDCPIRSNFFFCFRPTVINFLYGYLL